MLRLGLLLSLNCIFLACLLVPCSAAMLLYGLIILREMETLPACLWCWTTNYINTIFKYSIFKVNVAYVSFWTNVLGNNILQAIDVLINVWIWFKILVTDCTWWRTEVVLHRITLLLQDSDFHWRWQPVPWTTKHWRIQECTTLFRSTLKECIVNSWLTRVMQFISSSGG